jgi:V/A-type H+-transporting ATPase subunit F
MKFYCIADEDTVRGFRLSGVDGTVATSAEDAARTLATAAARPDCGVIILTEPCAAGIRPLVTQLRLERDRPLIVEIPGPAGPLPGNKRIWRLVQEAVGLSLEAEKGAADVPILRPRP